MNLDCDAMTPRPKVAIDGPVAAGKSTIARLVADRLGLTYIDTGAMYRALAWAAQREGTGPDQPERVVALLDRLSIELRPLPGGANRVIVDGSDITGGIRTPEIGQLASELSTIPGVRQHMVARQQQLAQSGGVVMEGRDIQTVVMPDADVKIFLIATAEERARRRCLELEQRGMPVDYDTVLAEIQERDRRDSTRAHSPLQAAPDAVMLDSTGLTIEEVAARVIDAVRTKTGAAP